MEYKNIIVINGAPRSGKDTFVQYCQKFIGPRCLNISTVDFVKDIARQCGWDGSKTANNRKFLSDLKDLLTNWNDVPYKKIVNKIQEFYADAASYDVSPSNLCVFIHCREPKEIKKFVDRLGAKTLLIRRAMVENDEQSNHADAEVFNYNYDHSISNDATLEQLEQKAKEYLQNLGLKIF